MEFYKVILPKPDWLFLIVLPEIVLPSGKFHVASEGKFAKIIFAGSSKNSKANFKRKLMTTLDQIQEVARRIGEEFSPQRVILFGSYAYGRPTPDSDVDMLVITSFEGNAVAKSVEIQLKVRPPFPIELIVRSPEKVRERLEMGDGFMREILTKGKTLYETNDA